MEFNEWGSRVKVWVILIFTLLTQACSVFPDCYVGASVGKYTDSDNSPNNTPTDGEIYCQNDNWEVGYYHQSDFTRGFPMNNKEEISTDKIAIGYRIKLR